MIFTPFFLTPAQQFFYISFLTPVIILNSATSTNPLLPFTSQFTFLVIHFTFIHSQPIAACLLAFLSIVSWMMYAMCNKKIKKIIKTIRFFWLLSSISEQCFFMLYMNIWASERERDGKTAKHIFHLTNRLFLLYFAISHVEKNDEREKCNFQKLKRKIWVDWRFIINFRRLSPFFDSSIRNEIHHVFPFSLFISEMNGKSIIGLQLVREIIIIIIERFT